MDNALRKGATGQAVADLQAALIAAGYRVERTHVYDDATMAAVRAVQRAARLVVDGVYGTKTAGALAGLGTGRLLKEADLQRAADVLGVSLASIKAVNEVEARGPGFLADGRPVILFERHIFYRQLRAHGIDADAQAARWPHIVSAKRGGYAGGAAEYRRLGLARQVCEAAALESASWGAFQIMGFHWERLGYASVAEFHTRMQENEAAHLDAFVRFIQADPALCKALAGRKWAAFARGYNGPAYEENLYDVKLARAYARHAAELEGQAA